MRASSRLFFFVPALLSSTWLSGIASAQELQAPPPMTPPPAPGQPQPAQPGTVETNQKLDEAERSDSGRKFELFWIDGGIGGSYINMRQFSSDTFQIEKASAGGPAFSLGAGIRLVVFTLGARLRYNALSTFNMWQINGEAGIKVPISAFDFVMQLHGGYSFVGRLGDAGVATNTSTPASSDAVSIRGFNGGLDVGFDYFVSPTFTVGAGILADVLVLNRPPVAVPANLTPDQQAAVKSDPIYQSSGTSLGFQLAGGLRLGVHFGL